MALSFRTRVFSFLLLVMAILTLVGLTTDGLFCSTASAVTPSGGKLVIVRIADHTGAVRFEIVDDDVVSFIKKEVDMEYREAKKAWTDARNAWKAKFTKEVPFVQPQPLKPAVKIVTKKLSSRSDAKIEMVTLKSKGPFCVVQIVTDKKKSQPEVILKDEIKTRQYELAAAYYDEIKTWVKEKEQFEEDHPKTDFAKVLPKRAQLKVLKNGVKTLEKANAYLSKYMK